MTEERTVHINGISGITGEYIVRPLDYNQAATLITEENREIGFTRWLQRLWRTISQPYLGLPMDVDPCDISQAGWAIVFHRDESPLVKEALVALIKHRRNQIGAAKTKVLEYRPNDTWREWLARYGVAAGNVEPTKVPYYVLLVGEPTHIPYSFQYLLDLEYGVGRLSFDTSNEYKCYVDSLIDYETSANVPRNKTAVFFGTRHTFDKATQLSADLLVKPLADGVPPKGTQPPQRGVAEQWGFVARKLLADDATKANLEEIFCSKTRMKQPAFLFSATHGVGWPKGHPHQIDKQGALLCQNWPGFGHINEEHYFTGMDLHNDAQVHGMITFHFACYSAGTPQRDNFIHEPGQPPPFIADEPFVAMLPKRLLVHPQGGALAVIGHVERAWGYSVVAPMAGPQLLPFQNTIGRILIGQPVGYAIKDFNEKYAALSTSLSSMLEEISFGAHISHSELTAAWIERNDAQSYMILGDPAVRLRVEAMH